MIRLRPSQVDLTSRDVEETLQRLRIRREARLATTTPHPESREGRQECHVRVGAQDATDHHQHARSVHGGGSAVPRIHRHASDRVTHPVRGPGVTGPPTRAPRAHAPSPRQRMLMSSNEFLHSYLRYVASRGSPIHDPRQAPDSLAAFYGARAGAPEAPLANRGRGQVSGSPVAVVGDDYNAQHVDDDQAARPERDRDRPGSSQHADRTAMRLESSLRELERRFAQQMSLEDDDPSGPLVSGEAEDPAESPRQQSERPPSTPRPATQLAAELPATRRRPRLPPSRLSIAQAASSSPEKERDRPDPDASDSPETGPAVSAAPEAWRRSSQHAETPSRTESETDASSLQDRYRQARSSFGNLSLAETISTMSHSSNVTEASVVHHHRSEQQMTPSSSSSDLPSPPSGARPARSSLDPAPPASPAESDPSLHDHPRITIQTPDPPSVTGHHRPSVPATPRASDELSFRTASAHTPGLTPRASRRSMRVYHDRLPAESQPQTPSGRHIDPFNPAFTAPAGLRRVFRFPSRHQQGRQGSPSSPTIPAPAAARRSMDEQENTSVTVEAARWERRVRASWDRRGGAWRAWSNRRRHSEDGSPRVMGSEEGGDMMSGGTTLERTPDREFPPRVVH